MSADAEPKPDKWAKVFATLDKLIEDRRKADELFHQLIDCLYTKMAKDLPDDSVDSIDHIRLVARYMQSKGLDHLTWEIYLRHPVLREIIQVANPFQFDSLMRCWWQFGWHRKGCGYAPTKEGETA